MSADIHVLGLSYDINFNDADEGDCYAGDGYRIISIYSDKSEADSIVAQFNPVFSLAEKNSIICPMQEEDRKLKKQFGFTVHDIDNGYNFKLVVNTCPLT